MKHKHVTPVEDLTREQKEARKLITKNWAIQHAICLALDCPANANFHLHLAQTLELMKLRRLEALQLDPQVFERMGRNRE